MSGKSRKSSPHRTSDPSHEGTRDPEVEETVPGNGTGETTTETLPEETSPEEPAQVQLTIKGSDKSARLAAERFGRGATKTAASVVATPSNDAEPPEDPTAVLLSDGKNMVIVTRQRPRVVEAPDGSEFATNSRIPGRYSCPTSKGEIEELVFQQHGGSKYKCTIHPDTTDGENKILGHFTIEHPNPKCPPFIDGVTINLPEPPPEHPEVPTRGDPTLTETDPLAQMRAALQRRLERVQMKKEIEELEGQIEELEGKKKESTMPAPAVESDEVRKLREQNAQLSAQLAEKKVNDRFDRLEDSITKLASSVAALATAKPSGMSEESVVMKMFGMSQQHSKDMIDALKSSNKPAPSSDGDLDKLLDRFTKIQTLTGGSSKGGRSSEIEQRLLDFAYDQLMSKGDGGEGGGGDDSEDALKLAIREFGPIAKTFVEKKMDQEGAANGGAPLSPDQIKKIYAEAAQAAAKKVQDDLLSQGLHLAQDANGKLVALSAPKGGGKPVVPPRGAGTRVVSETRTAGGVVKKVAIQPENLTGKPKSSAEPSESADESTKGGDVPKAGVFPKLGPNGTELKIEFPIRPGELKYDRKYSVNFILDGIRSEIRQGLPQKAATDQKIESYVIGDAIEFLDDEILDQLDGVDSGAKLENLLAPSGDGDKIAEIKNAGEDEAVASYLRKLVLSIQREWQREKTESSKG